MRINPAELLPRLIKLVEIQGRERFGELLAQEIYDDRRNRIWLDPIGLDVLELPQFLSFVRCEKESS
jgi:hypothetical protein